MLSSPSLGARYKEMLLSAFPLEPDGSELFIKNTFDGDDAVDYFNCMKIFQGKRWDEVDFEGLYFNYAQFLMLSKSGEIYYLPAFLNNFFELKHTSLEYYTYFLGYMESGFETLSISQVEEYSKNKNSNWPTDHSSFEKVTPDQSKLVALFLANVANLLPSHWHDAKQAQRALTNYWGKFLLF